LEERNVCSLVPKLLLETSFLGALLLNLRPGRLENLSEPLYELPQSSYEIPSHVLSNISEHVLNLLAPAANVVDAVFHSGELVLPKDVRLPFKALLDTGALHSSYMSKDFHRLHWDLLEPFTERCEAVVKMADNLTTAKIRNLVVITATMTGPCGIVYEFKDKYNVIDCAHDIILGLPSIVGNVLPLLTSSLTAAKGQASSHLFGTPDVIRAHS
jgi:hypothetical protein